MAIGCSPIGFALRREGEDCGKSSHKARRKPLAHIAQARIHPQTPKHVRLHPKPEAATIMCPRLDGNEAMPTTSFERLDGIQNADKFSADP